MDFATFIAPMAVDTFAAEHWTARPLHLSAAGARLAFGWSDLNDLFAIRPYWTPGNTRLILNSRAVEPDFYLDEVATLDGGQRLADPAKIDHFLGIGASLVANGAESVSPAIRAVTEMLAQQFAAHVAANIYCSFRGVRAFHTHYDDHEVFAVQCEGEKTWRIHANRAERAWEPMPDDQAAIDAARGPVAAEITMRPGDLLYLPRGVYHDAIAVDSASLHVTFSVAPMRGHLMARVLDAVIRRDPAFGAYLPPVDADRGQAFLKQLGELAGRVADHVRSPGFAIELADAQRRFAVPRHAVALPHRSAGQHYARTAVVAEVQDRAAGMVLVSGGREHPLGPAYAAAGWTLERPAFSDVELAARFPQVAPPVRAQLIQLLLGERLIEPYAAEV